MSNVEHLAFIRGDANLWTPEQMLEYVLGLNRKGVNMEGMVISYFGAGKDSVPNYYCSQLTRTELIGLLEMTKCEALPR